MTVFKTKMTSSITSFNYTARKNTLIHWLRKVNKYLGWFKCC